MVEKNKTILQKWFIRPEIDGESLVSRHFNNDGLRWELRTEGEINRMVVENYAEISSGQAWMWIARNMPFGQAILEAVLKTD